MPRQRTAFSESEPAAVTMLRKTGTASGGILRAAGHTLLLVLLLLAVRPAAAQDLAAAIEERLDLAAIAENVGAGQEVAELRQFYAARAFQPLWIDAAGVSAKAQTAAAALAAADLDGLEPQDYAAAAIAERLSATDPAGQAELEVLLSRGVAQYAADLMAGRLVPAEIDDELRIDPARPGAATILAAVGSVPDLAAYLASFAPQTPNYARLKQALADYRAIAATGGWSRVPEGESLKPGMTDPRVPALRQRLIEAGDLAADVAVPPETALAYDPVLEAAVTRFQWRHGLDQDGVVGAKTVAAMNVPVEARIDQILINMERRRWMPDDFGTRYVFVNMADFELKVVDGPKTILDTRVVVGTPFHRTPVFSGTMTYVVLNPYWNITPTIARNEILPKLRKDAGYLAQHNIVVLSDWTDGAVPVDPGTIDWSQVSARSFPYKLRQEPGEHNALGRIKFMFPNPYNIYLHDTPSRELFKRAVRSFSHGCIRVQNPVDLGAVLLAADGWTKEKLDAVIASGEQKVITLRQPIPVHLTYLTAWVNKDGSVHFRDDIYGRDKTLAGALLPAGTRI
jgi:murein L,D-transpeptidase YcbB/YkuD